MIDFPLLAKVWLLFIAFGFVLLITLWIISKYAISTDTSLNIGQTGVKGPVLFVTAHPDDESMFFAPAILGILRHFNSTMMKKRQRALNELREIEERLDYGEDLDDDEQELMTSLIETVENNQHAADDIFILCLSQGNNDGIGDVRREEFISACRTLGLHEDHVFIIDHRELQDGPGNHWKLHIMNSIIRHYVEEFHIKSIISFDDYGVSGHPNHRAIGNCVKQFTSSIGSSSSGSSRLFDIEIFMLDSVSVFRKYLGIFGAIVAFIVAVSRRIVLGVLRYGNKYKYNIEPETSRKKTLRKRKRSSDKKSSTGNDIPKVIFVVSPVEYLHGCLAMFQHSSQLVWFRLLYLLFSRYMYVNSLKKIT